MSPLAARGRSGVLLLAVLSLLAFGSPDGPATARPSAGLAGTRPNIVLILTDDQGIDSFPRTPPVMPWLQGRVQDPADRWVSFPNAFENTPVCCPSRATILSGQWSHHTGVLNNGTGELFDESSTIATWLQAAGYRTGLYGRYLNDYPWDRGPYVPPGWDEWHALMSGENSDTNYYGYTMNENGTPVAYGTAAEDYLTDVVRDKAVAFIEGTAPEEPFFLHVTFTAPHRPWTPAPRHAQAYKTLEFPKRPNFNEADRSDKPAWVQALAGVSALKMDNFLRGHARTLLAVDEAVHAMLDALAARGVLDDTVVIVLTDNGFSFGEHRLVGKGCVYEECIRTPLVIRNSAAAKRTVTNLVGNVDLAATIAGLAGVTPGRPQDGASLVPLLEGERPTWRTAYLLRSDQWREVTGYWGLRTALWSYAELFSGEIELYDLTADPYQLQNLCPPPSFGCGSYEAKRSRLHRMLQALKNAPPGG
ncbi:MAG TPA: sulfatase [Actinomycetota bacterium]|nr:sulfatase [Actinomycetota bacterium]